MYFLLFLPFPNATCINKKQDAVYFFFSSFQIFAIRFEKNCTLFVENFWSHCSVSRQTFAGEATQLNAACLKFFFASLQNKPRQKEVFANTLQSGKFWPVCALSSQFVFWNYS